MALSRSAVRTCAAAVILVVGGGLLAAGPQALAADPVDDGADRSIDGATRFRQEEFLRSDADWVARAVSDRNAFPDVSWGTPLTQDETAEMNSRVRFQKGADDAIDAAAGQDGYGGAMYDWEHGRRLVVFTTGDPVRVRDAVETHIPEGGSLRVERVERSLDALTRTRDKVTGGESTTRLMGSHVDSESGSSADESWFTTVHYAQFELEQYQGITIEPGTNSACS